jgi:ketosteroid isomerase-like protein
MILLRHRLGSIAIALLIAIGGGCTSTEGAPRESSAPTASASESALSTGAAAYVDAVNAEDLEALVAAFAEDGVIIDVSRRIHGRESIRDWAQREVIGGRLEVNAVTQQGPDTQVVRVHWAPAGSGGWAADYTFTTAGTEITVAELQYAD